MRSSAIVDRVAALLERAAPFDRLEPEERRWVLRDMLVGYFEPDEVILEQGRTEHQFLYVVESGFVRLLDRETQRLVNECVEGDVFGSHGLIPLSGRCPTRPGSSSLWCACFSRPARRELPIAVRGRPDLVNSDG